MRCELTACGALLAMVAGSSAAGRSLVPDTASTVPDYFCTWNVQGFCCSYAGSGDQADTMVEANLFDKGPRRNWLGFYPKVRGDLTFLLDDAVDFPLGGGHNDPMRGNVGLHPDRFPSYQKASPAAGLKQLSDDVKARGWRDLGLWICNSRPNVEELPIDSDTYWGRRLAWCREAGIANWKVDWGIGVPGKPLWKFRLTARARRMAPDLWIEAGPKCVQADLFRTYDVHPYNSIPETLRRIAAFLARNDPDDRRMINCEDEVYIGAALACTCGVMRHPFVGPMPNGKPDRFFVEQSRDIKRRMDEVVRAVRWHRVAQPTPKGDEYLIDSRMVTDFKSKPAPARITRGGLPLPTLTMPGGKEPPYVLAGRHRDGEIGVATIPRSFEVDGRRALRFPLADVVLDVGRLRRPVGVFGRYRSLALVTRGDLSGKRILAQDLAGDTPVDITADVRIDGGRLTIPGDVIRRVGLMAATPGDLSDPGLVLMVEGLTRAAPKEAMKPGMFATSRPGSVRAAPARAAELAPAIHSPGGKVKVKLAMKGEQPLWSIWLNGAKVIQDGLLGVETERGDFSGPYELVGTVIRSLDSTWEAVWGDRSEVRDRCNELTVKLRRTSGAHRELHVILRAYDEGVALRYHVPRQPTLPRVPAAGPSRQDEDRGEDRQDGEDGERGLPACGRQEWIAEQARGSSHRRRSVVERQNRLPQEATMSYKETSITGPF